jgi:hypothetical protein
MKQDAETGLGKGGEEGRGWGGVMRRAGGAGLSPLCFESNQPTIFFQVASRYPRNLRISITIYFSGYQINEEISFFEAYWPSTEVLSSFDKLALPGYRAFSTALDQLISQ